MLTPAAPPQVRFEPKLTAAILDEFAIAAWARLSHTDQRRRSLPFSTLQRSLHILESRESGLFLRDIGMENRIVQSLIIRNDLEEAKSEIRRKGLIPSIAHIKTVLLAFHNLCELEKSIRTIYAEHKELSGFFKKCRANAEFFSYLRNKVTGHITDDLIEKALEWKPEIPLTLKEDHDPNAILIYNYWLLETAINTYVDEAGNHKVFESETDFMYPPDLERFEITLLTTIDQAVEFLSALESTLKPTVSSPSTEVARMDLFRKAGLADFTYLSKKGR